MALDESVIEVIRSRAVRETGGRPLSPQQRRGLRRVLIDESMRASGRGRIPALFEADRVFNQITTKDGRLRLSKAEKKAARRARETVIVRSITESVLRGAMAAADAPKPAPGAGSAPAAPGDDSSMFAARAAGMRSPFWRLPASDGTPVTVTTEVKTQAELAAMDAETFLAHAASAHSDDARVRGLASPIWKDA